MNNLKLIRYQKQITGTELAKKVGVSHSMIYMIENGIKNPSLSLAQKIASILNVSISDIWTNK